MRHYSNLCDPAGTAPASVTIRWPAEPALGGECDTEELEAVRAVLASSTSVEVGFWAGDAVDAFEQKFAGYLGAADAVALNGAGSAMDLVLRALGVGPGSEVIACSANFHGLHLSVLGLGAKLVLVDAEDGHLGMSPEQVREKLGPKTRAVIQTHLHGVPSTDAAIESVLAASSGMRPGFVIDAARSIGSVDGGRQVGSYGTATVFSLQSKKHLTTLGEGGMVTSSDQSLLETLRDMRSFGRGRGWGSNFKMTKVQAAVGLVQLGRLDGLLERRRALATARATRLAESTWQLPALRPGSVSAAYLFAAYTPKELGRDGRDAVMSALAERGIGSVVANPPTYMYNEWIRSRSERTRATEDLTDRLICTSLHPSISREENLYIADSMVGCLRNFYA